MASNVVIRGLYMLTTALKQQDVQQIMSGAWLLVGVQRILVSVWVVCTQATLERMCAHWTPTARATAPRRLVVAVRGQTRSSVLCRLC